MSSIRQQIVDAITARLEQIAPGKVWSLPDGSYTCASAPKGVHPWRGVPFGAGQVPALAFWDTTSELGDGGPIGQFEHRLTVTVLAVVANGSSAIDTARNMVAAVIAAVGSDPRWGGLAEWTDYEKWEPAQEQAGDVIAAGEINLTITYRTGLWRI